MSELNKNPATRFCTDCKFYEAAPAGLNMCMRPFLSLINGKKSKLNLSCEDQRHGEGVPLDANSPDGCGREARYFEPKASVIPPQAPATNFKPRT